MNQVDQPIMNTQQLVASLAALEPQQLRLLLNQPQAPNNSQQLVPKTMTLDQAGQLRKLLASLPALGPEALLPPNQPEVPNHLQWFCDALNECFDQAKVRRNQRFDQVEVHIKRLEERLLERLEISDRMKLAMILNAGAFGNDADLHPLPLPDGNMPGDVFPATIGAFKKLSETELDNLIMLYKIVKQNDIPQLVDRKRRLVAGRFGFRLVE